VRLRHDKRLFAAILMGGIVNRLQLTAVLGTVALSACSAADDMPPERPPADAGRDTRTTVRTDAPGTDRRDASGGSDADDASTTPEPDVANADASSPPPDVAIPPSDGSSMPPDRSAPPPVDAPLPPPDGTPDQLIVSCLVSFTVHGVVWQAPEAGAGDAQSPGRMVRLVGDATNLGSWAPTAGVPLTEISAGTWSGTANFRDQQLTEFKFVKLQGTTPEWETWLPFDSNRSLRVECFGDAGVAGDAVDATIATDVAGDRAIQDDAPSDAVADRGDSSIDAASDGPTADATPVDATADAIDATAPSDAPVVPVPARGRTYVGVFGVRPLDATK
jgi:hypothetical protein